MTREWGVTKQATLDTTPPRRLPRRMRLTMLLDLLEYRLRGVNGVLARLDALDEQWDGESPLWDRMDALDDRIDAVTAAIDALPKRRQHPRPRATYEQSMADAAGDPE